MSGLKTNMVAQSVKDPGAFMQANVEGSVLDVSTTSLADPSAEEKGRSTGTLNQKDSTESKTITNTLTKRSPVQRSAKGQKGGERSRARPAASPRRQTTAQAVVSAVVASAIANVKASAVEAPSEPQVTPVKRALGMAEERLAQLLAEVLLSTILNPANTTNTRESAQKAMSMLAKAKQLPVSHWLKPLLSALNPPLQQRHLMPIRVMLILHFVFDNSLYQMIQYSSNMLLI